MRTTIDISDATLATLRKRAGKTGKSFREVVEETLQTGLAASNRPSGKVDLKTYPIGIKAAYRGVSMNQLYDQFEAESHLKVAE
jgi:hypothetical protein